MERDEWTITHDPFTLKFGRKTLYADLGAERLIAADKGLTKIVVEVKSFLGHSDIHDLQEAFGQYMMYEDILQEQGSERMLYLAVSETTYNDVMCNFLNIRCRMGKRTHPSPLPGGESVRVRAAIPLLGGGSRI